MGLLALVACATPKPPLVVFVCDHGSAKSVVAAALFERRVRERGLAVRVAARGVTPETEIAASARAGLAGDGLAPLEPAPVRATRGELAGATRVVAFSPLPPELSGAAPTEIWDVPPVGGGYASARDAMLDRMDRLLDAVLLR